MKSRKFQNRPLTEHEKAFLSKVRQHLKPWDTLIDRGRPKEILDSSTWIWLQATTGQIFIRPTGGFGDIGQNNGWYVNSNRCWVPTIEEAWAKCIEYLLTGKLE